MRRCNGELHAKQLRRIQDDHAKQSARIGQLCSVRPQQRGCTEQRRRLGARQPRINNPTPALAGNFLAKLHWKRQRAASCSFKMISFSNINKQYGKQLLLVDASFQLNPGEKVGLVGPNGACKTTLFRMVVGEETPDEGAVSVPKKLTIGYFRRDVEEMQGRSVLDEAIAGSGRVGEGFPSCRRFQK